MTTKKIQLDDSHDAVARLVADVKKRRGWSSVKLSLEKRFDGLKGTRLRPTYNLSIDCRDEPDSLGRIEHYCLDVMGFEVMPDGTIGNFRDIGGRPSGWYVNHDDLHGDIGSCVELYEAEMS